MTTTNHQPKGTTRMHTHCDHHPTCHHHEPPRAHHDDCRAELAELRRLDDLRRHQRDELKRRALYAYGLWNDRHTPTESLCRAMRALLEATDFDR